MAQDLTVNIKTTSDVPQAMDRAKSATVSFGKQVDDIQKKFSMAFKDVFLSFLGPLALLGIAMNYIGKLIDDNRKKHEDANQAAIAGTNELMSAEDKYYANKLNNEKKAKEKIEEAKVAREDVTQAFLENDSRGKAIMDEIKAAMPPGMAAGASGLARNAAQTKAMQDRVQAILAPEAAAAGPGPGAGPAGTPFKGPEGFSNVVGVGANPVLDTMNEQLVQLKVMSDFLAEIARPAGGGVPVDFTKKETPLLK